MDEISAEVSLPSPVPAAQHQGRGLHRPVRREGPRLPGRRARRRRDLPHHARDGRGRGPDDRGHVPERHRRPAHLPREGRIAGCATTGARPAASRGCSCCSRSSTGAGPRSAATRAPGPRSRATRRRPASGRRAMRYFDQMAFDDRCFAAALLGLGAARLPPDPRGRAAATSSTRTGKDLALAARRGAGRRARAGEPVSRSSARPTIPTCSSRAPASTRR